MVSTASTQAESIDFLEDECIIQQSTSPVLRFPDSLSTVARNSGVYYRRTNTSPSRTNPTGSITGPSPIVHSDPFVQ